MPRPSDLSEVPVSDVDEFPLWEGGAWKKSTFSRVKTWIRALFAAYPDGIVIVTNADETFRITRPSDGYDMVSFDASQVVGGGGTNPAIFYFRCPSSPVSTGGYLRRHDDFAGAPIEQLAFDDGLWVNDQVRMIVYYSGGYHRGIGSIYGSVAANRATMLCFGEVTNVVPTVVERGVTVTLDAGKGAFRRLTDNNEFEDSLPVIPVVNGTQNLGKSGMRWNEIHGSTLVASGFTIPPVGLYFDGTASNYISTPDNAALDITGDIDLRAGVALDDWTPAAAQTFLSKWITSTNQRSYHLSIDTAGKLNLNWSTDGTAVTTATSSVAPTVTDGAYLAVRATLDVNDGAGNNVVTFYTSSDYNPDTGGGTWTQLGTAVTTAGVTSIFSGSAAGAISGVNTGANNQMLGRFCWAEIRNGIGGTVVAAPNANVAQGARFRDSAKRVWTLNGSAYAFEKAA